MAEDNSARSSMGEGAGAMNTGVHPASGRVNARERAEYAVES